MDIFSKVIFNMYQASSLFSLDVVGWGDFFVIANHFKGQVTWKGKCEAMEQKCLA